MFKLEMKNFNKKGQVTAVFEQLFTDLKLLNHKYEELSGTFLNFKITRNNETIATNYMGL